MSIEVDYIKRYLEQPNKTEASLIAVFTHVPLQQLIQNQDELPFDTDHIDLCIAVIKTYPEFYDYLPEAVKQHPGIHDAYFSLINSKVACFEKFPAIFKQDILIASFACKLALENCRYLDLSNNDEELIMLALITTNRFLMEQQTKINKEEKTSNETLCYYHQLKRSNRRHNFPALAVRTDNPTINNIQKEINICMDNAAQAKDIKEGDANDDSHFFLGILFFGGIALITGILMAILFPPGGIGLSLLLAISLTFAVSTLLTITSLAIICKSINRNVSAQNKFNQSNEKTEQLVNEYNLSSNRASLFANSYKTEEGGSSQQVKTVVLT